MSNETDHNKINLNSSVDSTDIENNQSRHDDVNRPKSRISSASSQKDHQQQSHFVNNSHVNDSSNETRLKSPNNSNHISADENQSPFDSLDHDDNQPTFNKHLGSSSYVNVNEISNDGPNTHNQNLDENLDDGNTDDDKEQVKQGQIVSNTQSGK